MGSLRERMHELSNEVAAIRLWLLELQRQPLCSQCASHHAESLALLTRLIDRVASDCAELRVLAHRIEAASGH
jgi:hypothetical protein